MPWYLGGIDKLVDEEGIKKQADKRKNPQIIANRPLTDIDEYLAKGWTIKRQLKTRVYFVKDKPWYEQFQDLVWTMLAEMGFAWLNSDPAVFKLDKGENSTKQIDVFGIDKEDVVVLAECKAAKGDTPKNVDFDDALNDIREYRSKVTQNLNQHFETKPKYIFLFCTSNYIVGEKDRETMRKDGIVWLDRSRIEYFINLTSQIGVLAKYQFLGEVLAGSDIPNLKDNKVPAIRTKMGGMVCYSMMLHPSILLKIGYVLHRTENSTQGTYQRYVQKKRLNEVSSYIKNDGFFPNSILLNFDNPLSFEKPKGFEQKDEDIETGFVTLPRQYRSAFIIDGQHRLYGYAGTDKKDTDVIPVIAFEKLPPDVQTRMFVDINTKSVQVKRNLLEALNGEIYWNSPNERYALTALNSVLALELDKNNDSPFFELMIVGDEKNKKGRITLTYFIDKALKDEGYFVSAFSSKGKATAYGPFYDGDLTDKSKAKAYRVLVWYFSKIKKDCPIQWDILLNNIGISTLSWMLKEFLDEKRKESPDIFNNRNANFIINAVSPRVELLCAELTKKDSLEVKSYIEGKFGYGGITKACRFFERLLHEADPTFTRDGLEQWITEQSGQYSKDTKEILNRLSPAIISTVENKLKDEFGDEYYLEFSPDLLTKVAGKRKEIKNKANELNKQGIDSSEVHSQPLIELADIRQIVLDFWRNLGFEQSFKDRAKGGTKEETTEWLNKLVAIQKKLAGDEKISMEEYQEALTVAEWFLKDEDSEK